MRHLLTDKCDIYPLMKRDSFEKFGLPSEDEYFFEDTPTKMNVSCYIYRTGAQTRSSQQEPFQTVSETLSAIFLPSEEIKHNDRIVFQGQKYRIENPLMNKSHHIEALAVRVEV
jgi:hypothetical protein